MLKSIAQLKEVQTLDKEQLKSINRTYGGNNWGFWACERSNSSGETHHFSGNQSSSTAQAWVNAWVSLGWSASCTYIQFNRA